MDVRADAILRRHGAMVGERGIWHSHWQEIAERVLPRAATFITQSTAGDKRTEKLFDATAPMALERYAAAVESLIMPRNETWHGFEPADEDIREDHECKLWCDELTKLVFRVRYLPQSAFSSQGQEALMSLGAFGTAGMMVDNALNYPSLSRNPAPIVYRAQPLDSMYIMENAAGQVDTVHRELELDARQAVQQFSLDGDRLPGKIKDAAEKGDPRKWSFVHAVNPANDTGPWQYEKSEKGWSIEATARFHSCYVSRDDMTVVRTSGYTAMPYAVSRNVTAPRETYGRSPAMSVLPDIKMINEVAKTTIRGAQKAVDPPLLLADDGTGAPIDMTPGAANYGHVDSQGRVLAHPFIQGGRFDVAKEVRQDLRSSINSAFLVTLFQILVENKQMTAYEAALRAQEKGILLAPTMGRQETELLAPMVERELDILWDRGIIQRYLPPMPRRMLERGGVLKLVYTSPLARLAKAAESVAVQKWIAGIGSIAAVSPGVVDNVDFDACATIIADAEGVPAKARRSPEEVLAIRQKKDEQANAQLMLQAAPIAAATAKDASAAAANAAAAPMPA